MFVKPILFALGAALLLFVLLVMMKRPSHDRLWQAHLSRLPDIAITGETFQIGNYRQWTYAEDAPPKEDWGTSPELSFSAVKNVWFVLEPHPGLRAMAHTLVLFEFQDGELIGLTVEARKQKGEPYSPVKGAMNAFELIFLWATPKDLLTRRAIHLDKDLHIYKLEMTPDEKQAYLRAVLAKSKAIVRKPRFYNTLRSNCTNELAKSGGIAWHPAFILTGYSDGALYKQQRIAGQAPFADIRAAAKIDDEVAALNDETDAAFNAALLARLKNRAEP